MCVMVCGWGRGQEYSHVGAASCRDKMSVTDPDRDTGSGESSDVDAVSWTQVFCKTIM